MILPPLLPFVCDTLKWWWCLTMHATDVGDSRPLTSISFINEYNMWSQRYFPVIISSKGRIYSGHAHNKIKARKLESFLKILCLHYITSSLAIYAKLSSILLLFNLRFSRWDLLSLLSASTSFGTPNQTTRLFQPSWSQQHEDSFHVKNLLSHSQQSSTFLSPSSLACLSRP